MFGYVRVYKPELKVAEFDTYKGLYCSLCKNLGKNYGHLLRMTLSYDFTFLIVLALSVKKSHCEFKKSHCVYNPLKKCYYNTNYNEVFDTVSAIAVIMLYYKAEDNVRDERGFRRTLYKIVKLYLSRKMKKAASMYPEIFEIVRRLNIMQSETEMSENTDMDTAAEPTAVTLAEICEALAPPESKNQFYRIGYCVGKWVYLADAIEDLDNDIKCNRFNPLKSSELDSAVGVMNICSNEAGSVLESVNTHRYQGIIKNILYIGMPVGVENLIKKRGGVIDERSI